VAMMARRQTKKVRGVYEHPKGSGVWWVQFFVNGRRRRERVGPSKSEAVALYQLRKTQVREGRLPQRRPEQRFEDFVKLFLDGERQRMRSFRDYERFGRSWCERFAGRTLRSIMPLDIEQWATRRIKEAAPSTVNHELSFLRRVFNVALANDLVERNPTKRVKFYKEPSGRVRWLTDEEEEQLRQEMGEEHWPLVGFAIATGLRQSEQLGLRWRDVDLKNRVLTIPRSKHGGVRHVPLNDTALSILRALPRRLRSEYVFTTTRGTRLNPANILHRIFAPALEGAGIADFRWHDLRHTFASRLVMRGVDLRTVQELLGHKSLAMTLRYSHLAPDHLQAAIRVLDGPPTATKSATRAKTRSPRS
jgi:site-specific recombinase XerD